MNILNIDWPENEKDAVILYLDFLIGAVQENNINFPEHVVDFNSVEIAKKYINNEISANEYRSCADYWWKYLDDSGKTRDFSDHDALVVRVAICLLSATENDAGELGEHLAWFFELMDHLDVDINNLLEKMKKHFSFKQ